MGCLVAQITPDGEFVIARGDPRHPEHHFGRTWTEAECHKEGALTTFVFDRDGSVLFRRSGVSTADDLPGDLAEAFRQQTGRSLPPVPEPSRYSEACEGAREGVSPLCFPGPNELVITSRGNEIRAVRRR